MAKKQKSGLYRTKIKIGVNAAGKDVYKYISGRTMRELEQHRQEVIAYYIDGERRKDDRLFGEYAVQWYHIIKAPTLSKSSQESYRTALNKDILPKFGNRKLRSIQPMELQEFLYQFTGRSQTKITYICATLRGIYASACRDRIVEHDPTAYLVQPEASEVAEKRALTPEERARLEKVCMTSKDGAYLAAMYYLGVRPGEARGLKWGDFDWTAGTVTIQRDIDYKDGGRAGELKSRSAARVVPVPAPLRAILLPQRAMPRMYLFRGQRSGTALAKKSAEILWLNLMREAGFVRHRAPGEANYGSGDPRNEWAPTITAHMLRHNYITLCWEHGIDVNTVKRLVGHSSITTTLDTYTHLSAAQLNRVSEQLSAMFAEEGCTKVAPETPHTARAPKENS